MTARRDALLALAERVEGPVVPLRDRLARAFDDHQPFFLPGPKTIDGHRTATRLTFEDAPAFHRSECYALADVALRARAAMEGE